jgi:hypothetical protein
MQDAVGRATVAAAGRAGDSFARAATAACFWMLVLLSVLLGLLQPYQSREMTGQ